MKAQYARKTCVEVDNKSLGAKTDDKVESPTSSMDAGDKAPQQQPIPPKGDGLQRFTNMNLTDLLFVEIFAGTARLSKAVKELGVEVLPVDKTSARASQIYIAQYDLTDTAQMEDFMEVLEVEKRRILAIHLAPACGTASKAREKKLASWAKKGFKIPKPLRSAQKPMGVDGLEGLDKIRTETANMVYAATARIISFCVQHGIVCSVENPENSLFWLFPEIQQIMQSIGGFSISFHNCMHGGKRKKLTKWWATQDVFSSLQGLCDDKHQHAKWNPIQQGSALQFPTAEEAAYPHLLCKRIAAVLQQYAITNGALVVDTLGAQLSTTTSTSHRWILDMLPKGKKLKPLVSEFQSYSFFLVNPSQEPESAPFFLKQLKGSRVVQRQLQWGKIRVVDQGNGKLFYWENNKDGKQYELGDESATLAEVSQESVVQAELCTLGIPREPWDFVQRAVQAGHPRSLAIDLSGDVKEMLKQNFADEPYKIIKERATFLKQWTVRCKELEAQEQELHCSLEPHMREVLSGKRLLLFREMLLALDYPDQTLVDAISRGFQLSGWLPKSNVFPTTLKRPSRSMDAVQGMAKGLNKNIVKQVAAAQDEELATEVWELTAEELEKGWAWIDEQCDGKKHVLAKRFGLRQGAKTRLIDDCSVGGFNSTCGSSEKLKIHAIDEMAAYIAWCLTTFVSSAMEGVVGKTYDLKNAYKQYGICAGDRSLLRIAVWNPILKKVQFLGLNALPFGAVGLVSSFLRISMAIWYIGVRGLRLCWTAFFDDYTLLSKHACSNSASVAAESLFKLLGVDFAKEGKKAVPWGTQVCSLGVKLDLATVVDGETQITIGHTESRVRELSAALESIELSQVMSLKDAEKLRGRLQWFETFAGGRVAQQALRSLSRMASTGRKTEHLTMEEISTIRFLRERVICAPPTRISATSLSTWLVFTDGACEGEVSKLGTIGAVLISPCGVALEFISEQVPSELMDKFLTLSKHPIFELELLPVWIALTEWEGHLVGAQCVFYLDNEAAKASLVNGCSSQDSGAEIIQAFVYSEMGLQVKVWFARVPTSSNISDGPSRLEIADMQRCGAKQKQIHWRNLLERMGADRSKSWGFKTGS